MAITPDALLTAIDRKRVKVAAERGLSAPIPYAEVADILGFHRSLFSRLQDSRMPSETNLAALVEWAEVECGDCFEEEEFTSAIVVLIPEDGDPIRDAVNGDPHMTVAYLGDAADLTNLDEIRAQLEGEASVTRVFSGVPTSRGELGDDDADVVFFDLPGGQEFADILAAGPVGEATPEDAWPFNPHVTLGYPDSPGGDYDPSEHEAVRFDRIGLWVGGVQEEFALLDEPVEVDPDDEAVLAAGETVNVIQGVGKLSDSADEETAKAVGRVRELLTEGAVGVSVALDMHPDDAKVIREAWDKGEDEPEGFSPRLRIRHTAIVDTPAFADMRLTLDEDGQTVRGTLVVEGYDTGDLRVIDLDKIELEASPLPHPIIWDREEGDHTGMVVGYISELSKSEGTVSSDARVVLDDEAITAAMAPLSMPAAYFAQTVPTKAEPLRISLPDAQGYRTIRGLAAPAGVCLRQATACWTWPGDVDKAHRHFHTGSLLRLDDGKDIRVGALTLGGRHLDAALSKQGLTAAQAASHREDANRVFALVRVWETRFGLMLSGVIPPDVTDGDVARALACSPSIEFWPERGGRTLIGLHLVPTPGLPVLASAGVAEHYVTDIQLVQDQERDVEPDEVEVAVDGEPVTKNGEIPLLLAQIGALDAKADRILEIVATILELIPIGDIDIE